MIQPIQLTDQVFAVKVPEGATQIEVLPDECDDTAVAYKGLRPQPENQYDILCVLPGLNWQLICTTKECTEAIAAQIVEKDGVFFKCYAGNRSHISSLRSLFCLMDERKCDLTKILLIIKKVS